MTLVVPLLTYLLMKEDLTLEEVSGLAIDVVGAGVDTVRSMIIIVIIIIIIIIIVIIIIITVIIIIIMIIMMETLFVFLNVQL